MCLMSSFRFNFSSNENNDEDQTTSFHTNWIKCQKVPSDFISNFNITDVQCSAKTLTYGTTEIKHIGTSEVIKNIKILQNDAQFAESNHSDLVTGRYEGGLKIWECTSDLLEYLSDHVDKDVWKGSSVLDLGCGVGLLGIFAFINGSNVTFQDYNKEVLENATIPNILLNMNNKEYFSKDIERVQCYSGDWESFNKSLENNISFDFILTSETIYNEENYMKIIDILKHRLSNKGVAFIAAKTYYFGVGGSVSQFEVYLRKNDIFNIVKCWKTIKGIQREIIKVTKNKPI